MRVLRRIIHVPVVTPGWQDMGVSRALCATSGIPMPTARPLLPCADRLSVLYRRRLAIVCLPLALAACASLAPPEVSPVAVPATWSGTLPPATAGNTSLAEWWLRFDDPLLASLVDKALHSGTSVRTAQASLRQARALRDVAGAALWPSLGSSASAQRSRAGGNSATNNFQVGLDAGWELDIFGANRSGLAAGNASARASAASLGGVQVSMAAEVGLAYIALRGAQARLLIATANLESQQETLQITDWRLQAGLVTSLESEQARTLVEQTRALLPALQTSVDQNSHALAVLTGQPPAALLAVLATAGPIPRAADGLALNIPAETLRQRPDVRAAEFQVSAAVARVAQAQAARAPDFRLGGNLGLSAATLGALSSGSSVLSALLAGVTLPLFDGGALRAQVRVQQAVLDQARLAYEAAVLTALKDVEDALVALSGDRQRLLGLQNAAQSADNAALLARQRYGSGLVDFQVVLETQRTRLNTQDAVAGARADLAADHVRLYKALGGGWRPEDDELNPTPTAATRTSPQ